MIDQKTLNGTTMYQRKTGGFWYRKPSGPDASHEIGRCTTCGVEYFARRSKVLSGKNTYCSIRCSIYYGESHHMWAGENLTYSGAHSRVLRERGRAIRCMLADDTCSVKFSWASLTGNHGDPSDYLELCVSHHNRLDRGRYRGEDMTPILRPAVMRKECEAVITPERLVEMLS